MRVLSLVVTFLAFSLVALSVQGQTSNCEPPSKPSMLRSS
jgi:hypothetical protein